MVKSFWYYRPKENFPPPNIRWPKDCPDGDRVSIVCTQTNLPSKQQRELVSEWCNELPRLHRIRWLWLKSRVPQSLFDAACAIPHLEGLWIKWVACESIDELTINKSLKCLHLGNCSGVLSFAPLAQMTQLTWLDIEHFPKIGSIDALAPLANLTGLSIEGSMSHTQLIQSLEPLTAMRKLQYLSLANVRVADNSLKPLTEMRDLETLILPKWWDQQAVAAIRRMNSKLKN